jgi:hypothetical protein
VVIVTVTRSDLRDETDMANEAFALSPMSARAAEPNEQDYDAIREAFMETARGRWFLGEFAKRNRNADTRMVLDAVAKIEETLAAQRQPVVEDRLPEALVAIRRAVEDTAAATAAACDPAVIEAGLGPIHRGVRIIREISWRWREIGADGRICDLIDSQLVAIEGACTEVSTIDPRAELAAAFDLLKDRIAQTGADSDAAQPAVRPAPVRESPVAEAPQAGEAAPAMTADAPVAFTETPRNIAAEAEAAFEARDIMEEASMIAAELEITAEPELVTGSHAAAEASFAERAAVADEDALDAAADAFDAATDAFDAAAEAEDDAVLERIALEMAAPDPEFDAIVEPVEMAAEVRAPEPAEMAEPIAAEPAFAPIADEPDLALFAVEPAAPAAVAQAAPPVQAPVEAPVAAESLARLSDAIAEAAAEVMRAPAMAQAATLPPMPSPLPEASLGATILASGILKQKPRAPANDPLAPIRRMTQAEKIAFFS